MYAFTLKLLIVSGGFKPSDKEGARSSRSGDKVEGGCLRFFFRPLGPQFGPKIRGGWGGGRAPPLDPPLIV